MLMICVYKTVNAVLRQEKCEGLSHTLSNSWNDFSRSFYGVSVRLQDCDEDWIALLQEYDIPTVPRV